jgi:predicted transglutaminase-like cysteine proteinase
MTKLLLFAMAWLLLFAVTMVLIHEQLSQREGEQPPDQTNDHEPQDNDTASSGFVALQVNGSLRASSWTRGIADLPVLSVEVGYTVRNVGNASADIVAIEISLDALYYSSKTVHDLMPRSAFTDSFVFSVDYDRSRTAKVEARYATLTRSWNHTVYADLPRHPPRNLARLFVTPNEDTVEAALSEMTADLGFIPVKWMAIRDWVGSNIQYADDLDSHGAEEYWQLGKETLEQRMGDGEDLAVLLCSLLRADGWSPESVYVVVGQNEEGEYHTWVKLKIPIVGWYNIDPQLDGWNTLVGDFMALRGYQVVYNFNDQYFVEV